MTLALKVLKEARKLISDEDKWTTGLLAVDRRGTACPPTAPEAECFCSMGAIERAGGGHYGGISSACRELRAVMDHSISFYNDNHSHAQVLAKWDEAIAKLEREAACLS